MVSFNRRWINQQKHYVCYLSRWLHPKALPSRNLNFVACLLVQMVLECCLSASFNIRYISAAAARATADNHANAEIFDLSGDPVKSKGLYPCELTRSEDAITMYARITWSTLWRRPFRARDIERHTF
jgi:hypothetical protein